MTLPAEEESGDPGAQRVQQFLLYSLSLPERALRGASGVVGGALKHSAGLLLPQAFQDSRTYTMLVRYTLDFLINDMAGVKQAGGATTGGATAAGSTASAKADGDGSPATVSGAASGDAAGDTAASGGAAAANIPCDGAPAASAPPVDQFVARKTVGSFLDLAGMATLHLSPLVVLAVMSDIAYGSRAYLQELSRELKERGLIDERSTIDSAGQLLDAVAQASSLTAGALDTPPLSVDGLRETINQTRDAVSRIDVRQVIPQAELERMWCEMHEIAAEEQLDLLAVSSAITLHSLGKIGQFGQGALSGVRVAGNLVDRHILDHYRTALADIRQRGFYSAVAETSAPYIAAVWENFSSARDTWTEQLLTGRLWAKARSTLGGLFAPTPPTPPPAGN